MEFRGLKIDFTALAALIGSISSLYLVIKGTKQRKRDNKKKEEDNG